MPFFCPFKAVAVWIHQYNSRRFTVAEPFCRRLAQAETPPHVPQILGWLLHSTLVCPWAYAQAQQSCLCHPCVRILAVRACRSAACRDRHLRALALAGLIIPAEPYLLWFQLVHMHFTVTPSLRYFHDAHSCLFEVMTSHSRKASTGMRILVPMRMDGKPSDFTSSYAFGKDMPSCEDSSCTLIVVFSISFIPPFL